jgi:hypothetical protein
VPLANAASRLRAVKPRHNQIDGLVLDVLLRKHKTIRGSLGISVPVPVNTEALVEALLEGLVLPERGGRGSDQLTFDLDDLQDLVERRDSFHRQWEAAAEREKRSRTVFAQDTIKVDEVPTELAEAPQ